jgi:AcrR family transcriptional regulator
LPRAASGVWWRITFSESATDAPWRDRAIDRSLSRARARSVDRVERLLAAARDLANEMGRAVFTVQQVCTRAGMSLKGFYGCFAGKDDLLVALLAEDSRIGAGILHTIVDEHDGPEARVRAYVIGVFELLTLPGAAGYARMLVQEHGRLSEQRPDELRRALAPMIDVLAGEISAAVGEGVVASPDPERDAQTMFALILDGVHDVTLGRVAAIDQAEYLWRFCWRGLRGRDEDPEGR